MVSISRYHNHLLQW